MELEIICLTNLGEEQMLPNVVSNPGKDDVESEEKMNKQERYEMMINGKHAITFPSRT